MSGVPLKLNGGVVVPPSIPVLVVEDHDPFRQFLCSSLETASDDFVCWEASDGLEAVQKAEELQPELILLDLGLPMLNGLEAAQRISKVSPGSKILFVSQESSTDVVQGAFRVGARGFVVKADAGRELLTAVKAVLGGARFVGTRFDGHNFAGPFDVRVSKLTPQTKERTRRHEAQFYSDDARYLEGLTQCVSSALGAGDAAIVFATESHRKSLRMRLQARGLDVAAAIEQGRYIPLDAAATVSGCMVNDLPDRARFWKFAGDLVGKAAQAVKGHGRVVACGELAPLLWADGNAEAALLIEQLSEEFAQSHDLDIFCGYVLNSVQREQDNHVYEKICAMHSASCCQ